MVRQIQKVNRGEMEDGILVQMHAGRNAIRMWHAVIAGSFAYSRPASSTRVIIRMLFRRFVRDACGQDLEYLLVGAFIAVAALAGLGSLGISTNDWFAAAATFVGEED